MRTTSACICLVFLFGCTGCDNKLRRRTVVRVRERREFAYERGMPSKATSG